MRIIVSYVQDTDDYDFIFREKDDDKIKTIRVNRGDIEMFAAAAQAAVNHGGYAAGWILNVSTFSDPSPP